MSTNSSDPKCAACDKAPPRPTLICGDCSEGVDTEGEADQTLYCTTLCRHLDLNKHQNLCNKANRRKQVYCAGELLKLAFHQFRELCFDFKISRVHKDRDTVIMYEDKYCKEDFLFFELPTNTCLSHEDENMVRSYQAATDVGMYFYEFCKKLLSGTRDPKFLRIRNS